MIPLVVPTCWQNKLSVALIDFHPYSNPFFLYRPNLIIRTHPIRTEKKTKACLNAIVQWRIDVDGHLYSELHNLNIRLKYSEDSPPKRSLLVPSVRDVLLEALPFWSEFKEHAWWNKIGRFPCELMYYLRLRAQGRVGSQGNHWF